jgi:microcystin-dependent protein
MSKTRVLADLAEGTVVERTSLTGSVPISKGTTAQRDGAPATGYLRYNTSLGDWEGYTGSTWASVGGVGSFPAGTLMLFQQTTAPTGWTKQTTHNNKALRVVSGTAGSGGTATFTSVFTSRGVFGSIGNTTLTTTQMPAHTHSYTGTNLESAGTNKGSQIDSAAAGKNTGSKGGNGSHNHSFSGSAMNFAVQYVDLIIAIKD